MLLLVALTSLVAAGSAVPQLKSAKPQFDGRIVGGSIASITNFPYQLSLQYQRSHVCGASIISANWAVTAAHCIVGSANQLRLRAGSTYSNYGGTVHQVLQAIKHGSYNSNTMDYDIAVLRVSSPFTFSSSVQPITLESSAVSVGASAFVSGWGTTREGGSASTILRQVSVPIVSDSTCSQRYASYGGITARMICAGYTSGGKDSCQGDSGGPLVANGKLVGVVSWGAGCARPNYPGVYSKVSTLRSWIRTQTGV